MQPEAAGYNTGVSALSVNFNRVRLNWTKDIPDPSAAAAAISENLVLPLDAIGLAFAEQDPAGPFVRAGAPSEDRWLLSPTLAATGGRLAAGRQPVADHGGRVPRARRHRRSGPAGASAGSRPGWRTRGGAA